MSRFETASVRKAKISAIPGRYGPCGRRRVMNTPTHDSSKDDEDPVERPIHDEWGVYDPEQAGFEAILKKLQVKTKKASVPTQARPAATTQPATDDDNAIWMTPSSVLKRDSK